ncbi:hypothetical protein H113_07188 [Trichophyton rubrum MR1459]|nr:hypothetical protein H100_07152 [Trichophyton rubrum MR850]EZF91691.1 hypothetical protein H113_07188 [Trichophyton rubrum MR1459]
METLERLPQATMLSSTMSFPEKAIYYPGREAQTYINLPLPNVSKINSEESRRQEATKASKGSDLIARYPELPPSIKFFANPEKKSTWETRRQQGDDLHLLSVWYHRVRNFESGSMESRDIGRKRIDNDNAAILH